MKTDKDIEQEVKDMFDSMSREEFKQSLLDAGFDVEDSEPGYEGLILFDEQTNIRQWYGVIDEYEKNDINKVIDQLLFNYREGVFKLFPSCANVNNVIDIVHYLNNLLCENTIVQSFVNYLVEIAFPYLIKICRMDLPNDKELISHIKLHTFVIIEEFNTQYPDDLEDAMINIIEYLPTFIDSAMKG